MLLKGHHQISLKSERINCFCRELFNELANNSLFLFNELNKIVWDYTNSFNGIICCSFDCAKVINNYIGLV